jgi:hypothetical protein
MQDLVLEPSHHLFGGLETQLGLWAGDGEGVHRYPLERADRVDDRSPARETHFDAGRRC